MRTAAEVLTQHRISIQGAICPPGARSDSRRTSIPARQFLKDPETAESTIVFDLGDFASVMEAVVESSDPRLENRFRAAIVTARTKPATAIGLAQIIQHLETTIRHRNCEAVRNMAELLVRGFLPRELSQCRGLRDALALGHLGRYLGNLSFALLNCSELHQGWLFYAATKIRGLRDGAPPFPHAVWDGEPLAGKTILMWRNRGPGDEVLYAHTIPDLIDAAGQVIIECDPRLVSLFRRSFPRAVIVSRSSPPAAEALRPEIDFQTTFGAPCRVFRDRIDKFPKHRGYLVPDLAQVASWRATQDKVAKGRLRIGFSWRSGDRVGNAPHNTDILDWAAILRQPETQFFRLQYDECAEELESVRRALGVDIVSLPTLDLFNDLDGLAAFIASLDLVISINNVGSNLAGAVGTPTWELCPDWSHLNLGQSFSPWYPAVRLYRRSEGDVAKPIIERMGRDLKELVSRRGSLRLDS